MWEEYVVIEFVKTNLTNFIWISIGREQCVQICLIACNREFLKILKID